MKVPVIKDFTIPLLIFMILVSAASAYPGCYISNKIDSLEDKVEHAAYGSHTCIDMTHQVCDGQCTCDGLACEIATNKFDDIMKVQVIPIQDYQLRIDDENDQFIIFDGLRRVGTIKLTDDSEIGALILKDNE